MPIILTNLLNFISRSPNTISKILTMFSGVTPQWSVLFVLVRFRRNSYVVSSLPVLDRWTNWGWFTVGLTKLWICINSVLPSGIYILSKHEIHFFLFEHKIAKVSSLWDQWFETDWMKCHESLTMFERKLVL